MSTAAVTSMVVAVVVVLGALALVTMARRADVRGLGVMSAETVHRDRAARSTEARGDDGRAGHGTFTAAQHVEHEGELARYGPDAAPEAIPALLAPPDPDAIGVSRRQFFNRATTTFMSASIGTFFTASMVAFLWPTATGRLGGRFNVGKAKDVVNAIDDTNGFLYVSEARTWLVRYPGDALVAARGVYDEALLPGMEAGLVALYQKCPHLGCRVPGCETSQWFECPCHGSRYNRVGEYKAGPAPRGLDRFPIEVADHGDIIVDTGREILGPPHGTNTTGQESEGPFCV